MTQSITRHSPLHPGPVKVEFCPRPRPQSMLVRGSCCIQMMAAVCPNENSPPHQPTAHETTLTFGGGLQLSWLMWNDLVHRTEFLVCFFFNSFIFYFLCVCTCSGKRNEGIRSDKLDRLEILSRLFHGHNFPNEIFRCFV